jgi:SET domain-containing protein
MSVYVTGNVEVGPSGIQGKGVFAKRFMPKGYYVGNYEGPPPGPGYSRFDFWDPQLNETRRGKNELRYMNSSETPNCDFDGYDCFTLRDIFEGEELTFDYNF